MMLRKKSLRRQPCLFDRLTIDVRAHERTAASITPLPNGTISVHLPPETYTLCIRNYARHPQLAVRAIPFRLSNAGHYPVFDLLIDGATQPVEIRRFSSKIMK